MKSRIRINNFMSNVIYLCCLFQLIDNQMIDVINQVNPTFRPELELHPFWSSQKHRSITTPSSCKEKKSCENGIFCIHKCILHHKIYDNQL